jgi:hypothetical protein
MNIRYLRSAAVAVLAGVLLVGTCWAAESTCPFPTAETPVANYEVALARLKTSSCLGDPSADKSPVVVRFDDLTNKPTNLGQTERLFAAVDTLIAVAQQRSASKPLQEEWQAMLKELKEVRARLAPLATVTSKEDWLSTASNAIPAKWRMVSGGMESVKVAGRDVNFVQSVGCTNSAPCPEFQSQLDLIRMASLLSRLASYVQEPSLADQYADAKLALGRWESYRKDAHHQYIWEVWVNGMAMGKDVCPEDAGTGMKMGFCKVPQSQWILLHPDAALRFSNSANKTSELKPALVVELLGRYQWKWKTVNGEPTKDMESRMGYSLAAVYTSGGNENRWGFGPMVHIGGGSFALTKASGGRWSLVVNVPLADMVFQRKTEYVDALRKINKDSFVDLVTK